MLKLIKYLYKDIYLWEKDFVLILSWFFWFLFLKILCINVCKIYNIANKFKVLYRNNMLKESIKMLICKKGLISYISLYMLVLSKLSWILLLAKNKKGYEVK